MVNIITKKQSVKSVSEAELKTMFLETFLKLPQRLMIIEPLSFIHVCVC